MNNMILFILIALVEGGISLLFLINIPVDPKNVWVFGMSPIRIFLIGAVLATELVLGWLAFQWVNKSEYQKKMMGNLDKIFASPIYSFLFWVILVFGSGIGGIFVISWLIFGEKYLAVYQRLAPIILYEAALCIQLLFLFRTRFQQIGQGYFLENRELVEPKEGAQSFVKKYKILQIFLIASFTILSFVYFKFATMHGTFQNLDFRATDQGAYLNFVQEVYETNFDYTGDRNRMPLYPFIQALFLDPNKSEQNQFEHGKQVNVVLSMALLFILYGVVSRFLTHLTTNFILIAAFGLYVFKASYFQAELLFYTLSFLSFLMMGWMLVSPSFKLGVFVGILAAFTHLTKASILPMFVLFLGFYALKAFLDLWQGRQDRPDYLFFVQKLRFHLGILLCVIISFLAVLYPYLRESKLVFGQYFYNVNSTFYIWYDSWNEAKAGTRAYGDRVGWPEMPPEEIPSFQKYIREHTVTQIKSRLINGLYKQYKNFVVPYTQFNYLAIYSVLLLGSSLLGAKKLLHLLKKNILLVGFAFAYFATYLLLYSWYAAINEGYRFTLSLFLPILFASMLALKHLSAQFANFKFRGHSLQAPALLGFFNFAILALVLVDLVQFLPFKLASFYFGE